MANKESFVFYKSWWSAIKDLPNDVRLEILDGINEYALSGILPEFKPMAKLAFSFIKDDLDRSSEKYQNIVDRNRENGKNGGRPKTENNPNNPLGILETQEKPNDNDNVSDNLNESKNEDVKKPKKPRPVFTPPILEDVILYFEEKGYTKNSAEKAFEYYDVADWKDSKGNQVKNWKQKMQGVWFKDENKIKQSQKPKFTMF